MFFNKELSKHGHVQLLCERQSLCLRLPIKKGEELQLTTLATYLGRYLGSQYSTGDVARGWG